ncbi:MAG: hypothetical protein LBV61_07630 [Burkholderiaceae bacterium]|jgi:hypothetical protein|nr:hypothetical protein [Burkholderiaceae bacterium]
MIRKATSVFQTLRQRDLRLFFAALLALLLLFTAGAVSASLPTINAVHRSDASGTPIGGNVGLNDWIRVALNLDPSMEIDPSKTTLCLNGRPISGRGDALFVDNALVFHLVRDNQNAANWKPMLLSPSLAPRKIAVSVSLDDPNESCSNPATLIKGADKTPTFEFATFTGLRLTFALVIVLIVVAAVWAGALKTTLLKDSLLPQLAPKEQTFSLGRTQMAFWFTIVFAAFVFLFFFLGDYNNAMTAQALILMGLSGATTIFAVAIDASKDTPISAANATLRASGITTYADVEKLDAEIELKQRELQTQQKAHPSDATAIVRLQAEISSRQDQKKSWYDTTRPFISQGWYHDLTTDINGPALHRLQMFYWTLALGAIFLWQVIQDLAMPQFSETLLALIGVTSTGYLGFKYPEKQN